MSLPVTEHTTRTARHTTFHQACGREDAPPIIFVHGWPELSISWRHQLPCFASLGFRAIAPDMRGYGRSSVYPKYEDYALANSVHDMLELLAALGHEQAIWVGHDWGSPVVWSLASHHPQRCRGLRDRRDVQRGEFDRRTRRTRDRPADSTPTPDNRLDRR